MLIMFCMKIDHEILNQEIAAIKGIESGTVKIGTFSSVSIQWLAPVTGHVSEASSEEGM